MRVKWKLVSVGEGLAVGDYLKKIDQSERGDGCGCLKIMGQSDLGKEGDIR